MKNVAYCFLFVLSQYVYGQLPSPVQHNAKLYVKFNKNVEFLGFAYFIAFEGVNSETKMVKIDGKEMLEKDWQNYGWHFYQKYKSFASSRYMTQALSVTEHLWLSDIIPLLLQVEDFPNAQLPPNLTSEQYIHFSKNKNEEEARKNASVFLDACNNLYRETNFDKYLTDSKLFYQKAINEVSSHIPEYDFTGIMERFYRKQFGEYILMPSLTLPKGMGFGPRYTDKQSTKVFNVFGAFDYQDFEHTDDFRMGFANRDKLRELSIHEFGHSFVNPEIYKLPVAVLDSIAPLFTPVREAMEEQGYNTWQSCLIEHFVRAGEIVIAEMLENKNASERLKHEYIQNRKFIYLPVFIEELYSFQKNEDITYLAMANRCMKRLQGILQQNPVQPISVFPSEPRAAVLHTEDIIRFWNIFDKYQPYISGKILQEEYIDKGSAGVKGFLKNRIENGNVFSKTLKKEHKYYEFIKPYTLNIENKKEEFYNCFEKLKKIYPSAVFPDVYFVIGRNNTGGTAFRQGLIIGAERFGEAKNGFSPAINFEYLDEVVSHELIHFQQKYVKDNTLLAQCVREGAADFLCELIAGDYSTNKTTFNYGETHKKELWNEFLKRKDMNDWTGWLYYQKDKSRPKDLGYWIGYKICQAFYNRAEDKKQAIYEMLNINDFNEFLKKSQYNGE
jgi:hypothetical protein